MLVFAIVIMAVLVIAIPILYWKLGLWKAPIRPVIIGPDEMAIRVVIGKPDSFLDSGLHFIPFFFSCYVLRFPKKMYNLDYPARESVSKRGDVDGVEFGAQVLKVDSVAYVTFPRCYVWVQCKNVDGHEIIKQVNSENDLKEYIRNLEQQGITDIKVTGGLVQILRSQVPIDTDKLKTFTEEAVVGALRIAIGKVTWRDAVEGIDEVRAAAEEVFKSSDGALIKAGFRRDDLRLAIEEIKLPPELERTLPEPDKARLAAQAASFVAETRAIETVGTIIEMMALSTGQKPEEICASIDADPDTKKEFLHIAEDLTKRRMSLDANSLVDIRVEGAGEIERLLLNLLAAGRRMPGGQSGREGKEEKKEGEKKRKGDQPVGSVRDWTPEHHQQIEEERRRLTE